MEKIIVVGVDGSEGSREALRWTIEFAREAGAEVRAVHVERSGALWQLSAMQIDTGPYLDELNGLLDGPWTKPLRDSGVTYRTELVGGDPATELLRIAEKHEAYLIVVGARKHAVLHELFIGSTAHKLVNRANRPVVLVPPTDRG